VPFQNKLILSPAPHGSLAFAAQGISQSVAVAFVVPGVMVSAQSVRPKAKVRRIFYLKREFTQFKLRKGK
jgi:hypothetical protein